MTQIFSHSNKLSYLLSFFLLLAIGCYAVGFDYLASGTILDTDYGKFYHASRLFFLGKNIYSGKVELVKEKNCFVIKAQIPERCVEDGSDSVAKVAKLLLTNLSSPSLVALLLPFGKLPFKISFLIWDFLSLMCGIASVLMVLWTYHFKNELIVMGILTAFFCYYPTFVSLMAGQVGLLMLLLLVASWSAVRQEKQAMAGIFLGLAFSIKVFLGLFVFLFFIRRQWRLLAGFIGTVLIVTLITSLILGQNIYWQHAAVFERVHWYSSSWNASFYGFLVRLFGTFHEKNIPLVVAPMLAQVMYYSCSAFMVGILSWIAWPRHTSAACKPMALDLLFSFTITAMLLISPLGWIYYFPTLLIPFISIWYWSEKTPYENSVRLSLGLLLFLSSMPQVLIQPDKMVGADLILGWSGSYIYALIILSIVLLFMCQKLCFSTQRLPMNNNAKIAPSVYLLLYTASLLPSFIGMFRVINNLGYVTLEKLRELEKIIL